MSSGVETSLDISEFRYRNSKRFLDFARNDKIDNRRSVPPPHIARQNIQLGRVLGEGSARDRNPALAQYFDDLFVTQWRIALFTLDQIEDRFLHAGVAHRF